MIFVLLLSILVSFNSLVIGSFTSRLAGWNNSIYMNFLIGFVLCNSCFTITSLLFPINEWAFFALTAGSVVVLLLEFKWFQNYSFKCWLRFISVYKNNARVIFITTMLLILAFAHSMYPVSLHYDAGLYHLPTIKWINEYSVVPGLTNLNYTFGYNFNIFTFYAATISQNWIGQPIYVLNFTLTCFFFIWICDKISWFASNKEYARGIAGLFTLLVYFYYFYPHISTTSNNTPVFIIVVFIVISITEGTRLTDYSIPIAVLCCYAITVKLSAIPLGLFVLNSIFTNWRNGRKFGIGIALMGFVLVPWTVRNVVLSGWLLYPFPYLDIFSVDWKVPIDNVHEVTQTVKNFAKSSAQMNGKWNWLQSQNKMDLLLLLLTASISIYKLGKFLITRSNRVSTAWYLSLTVSVGGIFLVFFQAPNLWYGAAYFCSLVYLVCSTPLFSTKIDRLVFNTLAFSLALLIAKENWYHPWHFLKNVRQRYLMPYPLSKHDSNSFGSYYIDKKLRCYYPLASDQCFFQAMPCSMIEIKNIHLRGETVSSGFRVQLMPQMTQNQ